MKDLYKSDIQSIIVYLINIITFYMILELLKKNKDKILNQNHEKKPLKALINVFTFGKLERCLQRVNQNSTKNGMAICCSCFVPI